MSYTYKMFEKELTFGNHVSYHFIYNYFDTLSPSNSKLYQYEKELKEKINPFIDLKGFQNAITTPNTTIKEDAYFHVGMFQKQINKSVKDFFKINTDVYIMYFTKKIKDVVKETEFKCGYPLNVFLNSIEHKFKREAIELVDLFSEESSNYIIANNFYQDGSINHDEINVEIIPKYSKENYFSLKNKLLNTFSLKKDVFDLYDKKFENYIKSDFHYHVKIKLKDSNPTVKFYRTFPFNPYT